MVHGVPVQIEGYLMPVSLLNGLAESRVRVVRAGPPRPPHDEQQALGLDGGARADPPARRTAQYRQPLQKKRSWPGVFSPLSSQIGQLIA